MKDQLSSNNNWTDNCDYLNSDEISQIKASRHDLVLLQHNVRGLISKQNILKNLLLEFASPPDILLVCETWLKPDTLPLVNIPNYKYYHKCRVDRIGGGVSILANSQLRTRNRPDLIIPTELFEYIVVELKTDHTNVLFVSGYRPPNANTKKFMSEYKAALKVLKRCKQEIVIGMDHNYDLLKSSTNTSTEQFLNFHMDNDLSPCITKPTRVTRKTATLIDNIIVSNRLSYNYSPYIIREDISDHFPCLVVLRNVTKSKKDTVKITKRNFTDTSIQEIESVMFSTDWTCLLGMSVNDSFNYFHKTLLGSIDKICPKKEYNIRRDKLVRDPWITRGLLNSLRKQKRLYLDQLKAKSDVSTNRYKTYRNVLQKTLRSCKLSYFTNKCVEYKQNSRKLWQLINQLINKKQKRSQVIDSLKIENLQRYDPKDITNGFCDYFASVGQSYADKLKSSSVLVETYNEKIPRENSSMFLTPTDQKEIKSIIMALPSKTSSGFDEISNKLLKQLCNCILEPLEIIFNQSMLQGEFPELMKNADVSPLYKSKLECEPNNYRPISLLLTISKILEKLIYQRTYKFMEATGQIYNSQYGFRSQHSCENAVSELLSEIIKGLQNGHYTIALFLDLSKAFDTLEHEVLLEKMHRYGIRGNVLNWYRSYLFNRKIRVKCQVASSGRLEYSDYRTVNFGTPQGSCLGPLIFLIFTNDLQKHLHHCSSILFADDTTLYKAHRNLKYLKWSIQDDMNTLTDWFMANKLTLNIDKTICMLFQPNGSCQEIELEIDNIKIKSSKETKFLGLWLDHHLSWSTHIRNLITKLKRNQCLLKHGRRLMTENCLKMIYFSHIQSHITYGLVLWGNHLTDQLLKNIQKIQEQCLQYIKPGTSFKEQNILRIDSMIELENNKFGYKLIHGLLPCKIELACVYDNSNHSLTKTHNYHTRNKKVPNLPVKMNKLYRSSFLNQGPQSLLKLNSSCKTKSNLQTFCKTVKSALLSQYP